MVGPSARRPVNEGQGAVTSVRANCCHGLVSVGPQLSNCVFCDGTDISQEHLVADWALRGAAKSRRPKLGTTHWVTPTLAVTTDEEPIIKAGVSCHPCNGGWIKKIDDDAAAIMKPMIRGERSVVLTRDEQIKVAAWVFKTALVCEAAQGLDDSYLPSCRQKFREWKLPPLDYVIMVGPAPKLAETTYPLGLRRIGGTISVNVQAPDGSVSTGSVPIPGYVVMMGRVDAIIGSAKLPPITPASLDDFTQVWPPSDTPVAIKHKRTT